MTNRYLENQTLRQHLLSRNKAPELWRLTMRKTIMTILGSALLAASLTQAAAAAEHHKVRKVVRPHAPVSDQFRNSNDYYVPEFRNSNDYYAPPSATWTQPGFYEDGAQSAPAGR
jgi:hypothetical protein